MNRVSLEEWTWTPPIAFGRDPSGYSWKEWVNFGNLLVLGISLLSSARIDSSLRRSR